MSHIFQIRTGHCASAPSRLGSVTGTKDAAVAGTEGPKMPPSPACLTRSGSAVAGIRQ